MIILKQEFVYGVINLSLTSHLKLNKNFKIKVWLYFTSNKIDKVWFIKLEFSYFFTKRKKYNAIHIFLQRR